MIKKIVAILLVFLCAFPVPAVTIKAESAYIENDEIYDEIARFIGG